MTADYYALPIKAKPIRFGVREIITMSANHFGITPSELAGKSRLRKYVYPRFMTIYFLRWATIAGNGIFEYKLQEIGREFDRDHSTVIHALRTHEAIMMQDHDYAAKYLAYKRHLLNKIHQQ